MGLFRRRKSKTSWNPSPIELRCFEHYRTVLVPEAERVYSNQVTELMSGEPTEAGLYALRFFMGVFSLARLGMLGEAQGADTFMKAIDGSAASGLSLSIEQRGAVQEKVRPALRNILDALINPDADALARGDDERVLALAKVYREVLRESAPGGEIDPSFEYACVLSALSSVASLE